MRDFPRSTPRSLALAVALILALSTLALAPPAAAAPTAEPGAVTWLEALGNRLLDWSAGWLGELGTPDLDRATAPSGSAMDPNGSPSPESGGGMDPNGDPLPSSGSWMDPNG